MLGARPGGAEDVGDGMEASREDRLRAMVLRKFDVAVRDVVQGQEG